MKSKLPLISLFATIVTMTIGILVIIEGFTHLTILASIIPEAPKMKFNTALAFVFAAIVLLLNHFSRKKEKQHPVAIALSVAVALIGSITLAEYIFGLGPGIDELFIKDESRAIGIYYAGRMSPFSALNFSLIGTGLLFLNKEKTATYQFFYLSAIGFISALMLVGYNFIADIPSFLRLPIPVAIGFITLSVAIWFAQPILQKKISFERKLFTAFVAVILLIAAISTFSVYYSNKRITTSQLVRHTNEVLTEAGIALSLAKDIESDGRGYIITGDSNYLEHFMIAKNTIFDHINKLRDITPDNPAQQAITDSLSSLVNKRISFSLQLIHTRNEKGFDAANNLMTTRPGDFYSNEIRKITADIQQEENKLLIQRQKDNDKSIVSFNRAFIVLLTSVFLLLLLILFSIRNNINDRKKAEARLTKLNSELEAFSYSVSHDLRAPLRGIIGFATILEEDYGKKLDDEARRIISVIKANTSKMGQLIDGLLGFSRMGRHEMIKTNIDTNGMVRNVIHELDMNSNIELVVHSLPGIKADINTIKQVWVNLISNAIKYTGKVPYPGIEIGSFTREGQIIFFVKDNGVGFDNKYKDKLFKVFQRLHGPDEFEGTGIGLALVEKIISRHGGKVWAEASINKGACFYFSLPEA